MRYLVNDNHLNNSLNIENTYPKLYDLIDDDWLRNYYKQISSRLAAADYYNLSKWEITDRRARSSTLALSVLQVHKLLSHPCFSRRATTSSPWCLHRVPVLTQFLLKTMIDLHVTNLRRFIGLLTTCAKNYRKHYLITAIFSCVVIAHIL